MGAIQDIMIMGDEPYNDDKGKYDEIVEGLKNNTFGKESIVFITGSGISTKAGIPTFRSKDGLFEKAQKEYNLSRPETILQINYFYKNPETFYRFYKKYFDISKCRPTPTHLFMGFLCKKGFVKRIFTQNIDSLELLAGVPKEKITFAHGTISKAGCPRCLLEQDIGKVRENIDLGNVLRCEKCNTPVKPKIVFYGEKLPEEFFLKFNEVYDADLAFIMGTSLAVYPFNQLPYGIKKNGWRVMVNKRKAENFFGGLMTMNQFRFNNPKKKDLFLNGTTDEIVLKLIKDCEWEEDFYKYCNDIWHKNYGENYEKVEFLKKENEEKKVGNNNDRKQEQKEEGMNIINENFNLKKINSLSDLD